MLLGGGESVFQGASHIPEMRRVCPAWVRFLLQKKLARALLPHVVCLAGLPHARFFTCGLALSLLQHKLDEWHHLHATPSSGATVVSAESELNKPTMFETTQPIPV